MEKTAHGPLAGIKVIELATVIAGPGSGRYLADFGAEVIKVEPPGGDPTRRMGWTGPGETDSYFWKLVNRNKSVITLDLKNADARKSLWSLLADADVLIENMRPGKLEALGFDCAAMLKHNPRLVVLSVSGFGQDGPYAQHPGFATIADGLTGFAALLGEPDGAPLLPPIAVTDEVTALVGAFATLVALRHAERTGEGQVIDVNLLESMFQIMGPLVSAYAHMGYVQPRLGSGIPYTVPRGTYRCADGKWVAISTSADSIAARVLDLIGLGGDERFATFQDRSKNREVLETYVRGWVAERPSEEVIREFRRVDAAIGPVLDMADIFHDPHYRAREVITEVDGVMMQNVVARLSKTPARIRHIGRKFGADTEEILARLARKHSDAEGGGG
jgi:crotonobetainyl-CoA:carnitine CoA-transferase CaiB-like acyl-CoA transferase